MKNWTLITCWMSESDARSEVHILEKLLIPSKKNYVDDKVEDYRIPLELVTRKETFITSRILLSFMKQFEKTTPKLLDALRKVRDVFQLDLTLTKNITK